MLSCSALIVRSNRSLVLWLAIVRSVSVRKVVLNPTFLRMPFQRCRQVLFYELPWHPSQRPLILYPLSSRSSTSSQMPFLRYGGGGGRRRSKRQDNLIRRITFLVSYAVAIAK